MHNDMFVKIMPLEQWTLSRGCGGLLSSEKMDINSRRKAQENEHDTQQKMVILKDQTDKLRCLVDLLMKHLSRAAFQHHSIPFCPSATYIPHSVRGRCFIAAMPSCRMAHTITAANEGNCYVPHNGSSHGYGNTAG